MMRSERKTEKWRIPGKWTLIFLLILLVFYGYQNILAENYERHRIVNMDKMLYKKLPGVGVLLYLMVQQFQLKQQPCVLIL